MRDPDECWPWLGGRTIQGHGVIVWNRKLNGAHRVSWMFKHGIDPGMRVVRHRCDNPPCVNPDHLMVGTHSDNMRDHLRKGSLILNEHQVRKIRAYLASSISQGVIAADFGISRQLVSAINTGAAWWWLP